VPLEPIYHCTDATDKGWRHIYIFNYMGEVGTTRTYSLDIERGQVTGSESRRMPRTQTVKPLEYIDFIEKNILHSWDTLDVQEFNRLWETHNKPQAPEPECP